MNEHYIKNTDEKNLYNQLNEYCIIYKEKISSDKIEIYNPFKNESFNAVYLSDQLFLRKDSRSNWNVLLRIYDDEFYPIDFKGNI